ncbi:three component ABC system middle component [Cereibacter sphaeroides]|uniref:three component ABC system middle component n=1 Tax=Cereibacter sphaeroides TaxID=1063 RepID=UPI0011C41E34|nr:three component ABC system middle component [Cereibacter sphaeroides]
MTIAYDLFAETNPAFGAYGLLGFCRKFMAAAGKRPAFALSYIALPIALSDDLSASFEETTALTGLLSWLNRYPGVYVDLGARLDASKDIVSAALRFGVSAGALLLEPDGTLGPGPRKPARAPADNLPHNAKRALKRADRLGTWMGNTGSAATIFSAFGVTP